MSGVRSNNAALVGAALKASDIDRRALQSALALAEREKRTDLATPIKTALDALPVETAPSVKLDPAVLQRYAGRYRNEAAGVTATISVRDGQLVGEVPGQPPITFTATGETTFRARETDGLTIAFNGRGGMVESVTVTEQGRVSSYARLTDAAPAVDDSGADALERPSREPRPRAPYRRTQLALVSRRTGGRSRRRPGCGRRLGCIDRKEREVENGDPGDRNGEPDRLGRSNLPHDGGQQGGRQLVPHRALRRRETGRRSLGTRVQGLLPRQEDREGPLGSHGAHRRAESEAAYEIHPGERHAGDGWKTRGRGLRIGGPPRRVRRLRERTLADRPGRPRQRVVFRSDVSVGPLELACHLPKLRHRSGGYPEGLVHRRVGSDERQAALEGRARGGDPHVGDADARHRRQAPRAGHQRNEDSRLRSGDRKAALDAGAEL